MVETGLIVSSIVFGGVIGFVIGKFMNRVKKKKNQKLLKNDIDTDMQKWKDQIMGTNKGASPSLPQSTSNEKLSEGASLPNKQEVEASAFPPAPSHSTLDMEVAELEKKLEEKRKLTEAGKKKEELAKKREEKKIKVERDRVKKKFKKAMGKDYSEEGFEKYYETQ